MLKYFNVLYKGYSIKNQERGGNGLFVRGGQIALSEGVLKILV